MNGCSASRSHIAHHRPSGRALRAGFAVLAASLAATLFAPAAEAQFLRSWHWHSDEGPPPIPPANVGTPRPWHPAEPRPTSDTVSLEELHRKADEMHLRLIAKPHRQGHVFIAFAKDSQGVLHHLVFDADAGTLLENGAVSANPKLKANATPTPANAAPTTIAAAPAVKPNPAEAAAKPAPIVTKVPAKVATTPAPAIAKVPDKKPAPAVAKAAAKSENPASVAATSPPKTVPSSVADQEDLTPIRPQPAWAAGPTPQDPNIDKD